MEVIFSTASHILDNNLVVTTPYIGNHHVLIPEAETQVDSENFHRDNQGDPAKLAEGKMGARPRRQTAPLFLVLLQS